MILRLPPRKVIADVPRRLLVGEALLSLISKVAPGLRFRPPDAATLSLPSRLKLVVPAFMVIPAPVLAPIATVCAVVKLRMPEPYLFTWKGARLMALERLMVPAPVKVI